jgi:hypothetical protein
VTAMSVINVKKVQVDGNRLYLFSRFRRFQVEKDKIFAISVGLIPSFFDELAIELVSCRSFFVTERADGFLDLATFLDFANLFGPLWYSDAESGRELEHSFSRLE